MGNVHYTAVLEIFRVEAPAPGRPLIGGSGENKAKEEVLRIVVRGKDMLEVAGKVHAHLGVEVGDGEAPGDD